MTKDDWEKLLDDKPDDWDCRMTYSTWLQDEVDDLAGAEVQRWMVKNKKCPDCSESYLPAIWFWTDLGLDELGLYPKIQYDDQLPTRIFNSLLSKFEQSCRPLIAIKGYSRRVDAEYDLRKAQAGGLLSGEL